MVNTRRMESNDTARCSRQRTRGSLRLLKDEDAEESRSSSVSESDSEDSADKDSSSNSKEKIKQPIQTKQISSRTLPQKFTFHERNYKTRALRSAHKRISLEERTLSVYSSRKMHHDSDPYEQGHESEEDLYTVRGRRTRHLIRMNRMQRRTALSLRPISQKCYADPRSPINFNTDSEGGRVRRSKRKKQSMSWLADSQMHKVGYPNLNVGYSEEDSRDAVDAHNEMEITRRVTRRHNDIGLRRETNTKYLYEYDNGDMPVSRSRTRTQNEIRTRRESNDKENKKDHGPNIRTNGRSIKTEIVEPDDADSNENVEKKNKPVEIKKEVVKEVPKVNGEVHDGDKKKDVQSSDTDDEPDRVPLSRLRPNRNRPIMCDSSFGSTNRTSNYPIRSNRSYPPSRPTGHETNFPSRSAPGFRERPNRNQKVTESSSSEEEEEERKYSLRDRRPKAAPKTMQTSVLKTRDMRTRRRFQRSQGSCSSSSDSSSDPRCRPPPKSPHSKNEKMKSGGGMKIVPIKPEILDGSVRFNSIGGLDNHIQCLKEMILLPMMYPEVFRKFQIQPPRGVLFYGPPGTGKTLIARALANECSFGSRKVSFFLRKGADLLSKWVGESEKQLRMLFQQAAEMKPSIIFFDELDGLAPVRSSRQDQVHASIVSTLLALMDGLDDRGEVIVIGATNRIDSIDPALRRPGRFDRELNFSLPSRAERLEILKVHVASWSIPPTEQLMNYLAENTLGYCGSDLRALCSEAVIQSFRRTYPQVYSSDHRLLLNPENVQVDKIDFIRAKSLLVPASHRVTNGLGRKLFPILDPLLQELLKKALSTLEPTFPHGFSVALAKVKLSPNVRPAQLLLTGNGPDHGQTSHLAQAILFRMEHIHSYLLDVTVLYQETGRSAEEACIQVFNEARKNIPSIIYIPNLDKWWELVTETVKVILISQITQLSPNTPILLLATADKLYADLPDEIKEMFSEYRKEIIELHPPSSEARRMFYKPLIINACLQQPRSNRERPKTPPPLPRAPTPPPTPLTEYQKKKLYETEEHTLRELRIFLRDMCKKLANNKLFFMFTKPVDTEEVPDYTTIIKQPMDLETMMTKVDFHRYECARDFLNDIELICQNALEYNPAKTSVDKQIRHRACSLRDYAYTLIKTEMDTDFEDKCQDISRKRRLRKHCPTQYLPPYINTPDANIPNLDGTKNEYEENMESRLVDEDTEILDKPSEKIDNIKTPMKKRKRTSWKKGLLKKKKKRLLNINHSQVVKAELSSGDDSKENDTETQPDKTAKISDSAKCKAPATPEKARKADPTASLTINCDTTSSFNLNSTKIIQSPKRRLSDILSPSELLDSPLDFDELDEALQESTSAEQSSSREPIDCSQQELEKVLEQAVKITEGFSLLHLMDLYNLLSRIVKKFSRTTIRTALPKELLKEISRFKKEGTTDFSTSLSHT